MLSDFRQRSARPFTGRRVVGWSWVLLATNGNKLLGANPAPAAEVDLDHVPVVYLGVADPLGRRAHRAGPPRRPDQRPHVAATCAQTRAIPPARRITRPCAMSPTQPPVK